MEFYQIRYFLCVSDVLSFTKAASLCNISQPALTKAIQKLEADLGGSLFIRDRKNISLTSLGQSMRTQLSKIESARSTAQREARAIVEKEMEILHVGIMCTLASNRIRPALLAFQTQNPNTELVFYDIWASSGKEMLLSGAIDCAFFGKQQVNQKNIESHVLYSEDVGLVMNKANPLAQKSNIQLSDLSGLSYADRLRCEFRDDIFDIMEERNLSADITIRSEREDWIKDIIKGGNHITVMPKNSAQDEGLVFKQIADHPISRTICIAAVKGTARPKIVDKFITTVKNEFAHA